MEIVRKCRVKDQAVIDGINKYDDNTGHTPLTALLTNKHCSIPYIKLLATFPGFDLNLPSKNKEFLNMTATEIADRRKKAVFKTILTHLSDPPN